MAIFSNQATLTCNGSTTNSNIAYGEILDVLNITKTAIESGYAPGDRVSYVVTLRNTGTAALGGIALSDDLGGYTLNGTTVYPLAYVADSAALFVDGVPQTPPTVTAGPPLSISGLTIPGGGDMVLVYQAQVTEYANPAADGTITNTVTAAGTGLSSPVTATRTLTALSAPRLTITKSISPSQVVDNDRVTYTFVIQNYGNRAVTAADNAIVTDTFAPALSGLTVTLDAAAWTQGTQYTYNEPTGLFATSSGALTVPAATFAQNAATGAYTTTPGTVTLVVTGTI